MVHGLGHTKKSLNVANNFDSEYFKNRSLKTKFDFFNLNHTFLLKKLLKRLE